MTTITEATPFFVSKYSLEGTRLEVISAINKVFDQAVNHVLDTYSHLSISDFSLYLDWEAPTYGISDTLTMYLKRPESSQEQVLRIQREDRITNETRKRELAMLKDLAVKYKAQLTLE